MNIDGQSLQRRDIKRMHAALRHTRLFTAISFQVHQRRQKPGQRFTRTGRRDQKRRLSLFGTGQKLKLMRARRPALGRKPFEKTVRQGKSGRCGSGFQVQCHAVNLMAARQAAKVFVHFCSHFVSRRKLPLFSGRTS